MGRRSHRHIPQDRRGTDRPNERHHRHFIGAPQRKFIEKIFQIKRSTIIIYIYIYKVYLDIKCWAGTGWFWNSHPVKKWNYELLCTHVWTAQDSLEAVHWAIDELKATVPVWKREYYEDGSVWKENEEWRRTHKCWVRIRSIFERTIVHRKE